jgi:hypothetical protein
MSVLLVACLWLGMPLAGLGVYSLQTWLEQADQARHAED